MYRLTMEWLNPIAFAASRIPRRFVMCVVIVAGALGLVHPVHRSVHHFSALQLADFNDFCRPFMWNSRKDPLTICGLM